MKTLVLFISLAVCVLAGCGSSGSTGGGDAAATEASADRPLTPFEGGWVCVVDNAENGADLDSAYRYCVNSGSTYYGGASQENHDFTVGAIRAMTCISQSGTRGCGTPEAQS